MSKPKQNIRRIWTLVLTVLLAANFGGGSFAAASPPPAEGSITIHKFRAESFENLKESTGSQSDGKKVPVGAEKLAGICFKLEKPQDNAFEAVTKATDKNGEIVFSGLKNGTYLVTELLPEGFTAQKESFFVQIPLGENYDVHVYPKNMGRAEVPNTQPGSSTETSTQPQGKDDEPGPVTGDNVKMFGYVLLVAGALAGLVWLFLTGRSVPARRKKQVTD